MAEDQALRQCQNQVFLISGMQWGDECKGKLVADLSINADVIAKFNGGHNAGHEVVFRGKTHKFHLIPCGVIHEKTINVLGNGVVIHLKSLLDEVNELRNIGVEVLDRLLISARAHLILDIHIDMDRNMEEKRSVTTSGLKIGTTLKGVGPCYTTKSARTGVLVGHMLHWKSFETRVHNLFHFHSTASNAAELAQQEIEKHKEYFKIIKNCITDTEDYIADAIAQGKRVLLEASNGSLLDLGLGTYPFVTSSNTLTCGPYRGLGIAPNTPIYRIGVLKSYQTRIGFGPFPTELFDDTYKHMQIIGMEIGVSTGRKRRCGWLDLPAARYAQRINDFHCINLTKLDVLSGVKVLKICIDYKNKTTGEIMKRGTFPCTEEMFQEYEQIYKEFQGWDEDISKIREYQELPAAAKTFVEYIQGDLGVFIKWVCIM
ncbi:bifunctional Adenylosuccinate synthetase/Adenylosuccinate synthetase [Babesia duncani]|uniref:Adenylosuccinate synthetase n=1 Tax=Babesia duncani TaxID=323732 RepID=A0AAD9PJ48_9APIC|nr:bifunctional Adenylosuccinate synthetase/Adenylosuccinate synthetase [Babesia duncani]